MTLNIDANEELILKSGKKQPLGVGIAHEFEDEYNVGFRELKIYNDSLIGSTMNVNTGLEVWEIKDK